MTWQLDQFHGKDIVFVGAGKGRAMQGVKEFLEKHGQIASFQAIDKQPGNDPLAELRTYDQARTLFIKNEAIPGTDMPVPYITALQLFFSLVSEIGATTIGITGTKGKSTTTSLSAHILQQAGKDTVLAGNIGISPLGALDSATQDTIFVLELSSYQLADLTVSPHISACINLYNDHTDWHGSLDKYWEAKHNIVRFSKPEDVFIYNPAFPELTEWANQAVCHSIAIDVQDNSLNLTDAQLFGEHNRVNALIARQIARECGVSDEESQTAIDSFTPLEHRMQVVGVKQGRRYIDDAIGMTPESTTASLTAISEKFGQIGCLLLGGQDRNYEFSALMKHIASLNIPYLVLFPDTIEKMRAALPADYTPTIFEANDMQTAVEFAAQHAPENSVVLLSTAAPSYSLWKDFEDKGTQFQTIVSTLV
jgi:UDP-N-acetylmuramoylalanine--D-glutamate ligase